MAKRGRKSGFNDKIRETILRLLKQGMTEDQISEVVGVSRRTLCNWKGKHQELLHAIKEAKFAADELVEASLYSRALGYSHPEVKVFCSKDETGAPEVVTHEIVKHYPPDTQAAMFWLRNRQPKRWAEKADGTDVNVTNNNNPSTLTEEQLDARIAAMLAKKEKPPVSE